MARPGRPELNRAAQSFRQLRRFHHAINSDEVFGTHSGVLGLTRSLARDYGPYDIRVNAIAPGWIMTERQIERWLTPGSEAELMHRQCLKRKLTPDELAKFTVFLASGETSACTGQHYVVDGDWV